MSAQRSVQQPFGEQTLDHVLIGEVSADPRPAVIIFPTIMGVTDLERGFGERLADLGHVALVADLYGRRFAADERPLAKQAMDALKADRAALRERLVAVLDTVRAQPGVDPAKVAAIGFCFGGLCALDLARAGADVAGVASFHGLLDPPGLPPGPIGAKVIAFHGWDDPLAPPPAVEALATELTQAGADWQVHAFGNTRHGFTNPNAGAAGSDAVRYDAAAARRSWAMLEDALTEWFA